MKSFKMLMVVALTILSISLFAQVTTKAPLNVPTQKSEKVNLPCPMHAGMMMNKTGNNPGIITVSNLSSKEKMKMEVMKINITDRQNVITDVRGNMPGKSSNTTLNLSPKEKSKFEIMKIQSNPLNNYVVSRICKCPNCNTDCSTMHCNKMSCKRTGYSIDKCPVCGTTLNLSSKEKMKMDVIKI